MSRERVLDLQLQRLLGPGTPDLRSSVLAAWTKERALGPLRAVQPMPRPPRRWLHLAAGLLGITLIGAAFWLAKNESLAEAETPLLLLEGPDAPPREVRHCPPEALLLCPPGPDARLQLSDGGNLRLEPGTVFSLRRSRPAPLQIRLHHGRLKLHSTGPCSLAVPGTTSSVQLHGEAQVEVRILPPPAKPKHGDPDMFRARHIARNQALPLSLSISLLSGSAHAQLAQGKTPIAAGEYHSFELIGPSAHSGDRLSAAERRRCDNLLKQLLTRAAGNPDPMQVYKSAEESMHELARLLLRKPAASAYLRERLLGVDFGDPNAELRGRALALLVYDRDPAVRQRLGKLLTQKPEAFNNDMILTLAEQDLPAAVAELEKRVKARPDRPFMLYPAAHLAMRGKPIGKQLLLTEFKRQTDRRWHQYLTAAAALAVLGDKTAWPQAVASLEQQIQALQVADQEIIIPVYIYMAQYLAQAVRRGKPVPLPTKLVNRISEYRPKQPQRTMSEKQIKAALRQLRD